MTTRPSDCALVTEATRQGVDHFDVCTAEVEKYVMGIIFKAPGFLIWLVAGFWGLSISLHIVYEIGGIILSVISLVLAPFLLSLAPWYSGLFQGDWFPMLLIYGGGISGMALIGIGSAIDGH